MTLKEQELASKQYISIIRLFEHTGIDYEGEINIARIKKQLNAEFGFTETGFIEIDGYTYNKTDVLEELDNPDFLIRLPYHIRIWNNKFFLIILEDNIVNLVELNTAIVEFESDEVFDHQFCGYLASPFNHISRNFISNNQLEDLGEWLRYETFILPQDREEAFRSIRVFMDETLRTLKNISTENYDVFKPKLKEWLEPGWYKMMNNLPDEFYEQKNDIVFHLINLTVTIQKSNKKDCRSISSELINLKDLRGNMMETIHKNDSVYNDNFSSSGSGTSYRWLIWVLIALARILASSHGCN